VYRRLAESQTQAGRQKRAWILMAEQPRSAYRQPGGEPDGCWTMTVPACGRVSWALDG